MLTQYFLCNSNHNMPLNISSSHQTLPITHKMQKTFSQSLSLTCPLAWLGVLKPHPFLSHSIIALWLTFCTPGGENYSLCCTQVKTLSKHCVLTSDLNPSYENFKTDRSHIPNKTTSTLPADSHPFPTSSFIFQVSWINIRRTCLIQWVLHNVPSRCSSPTLFHSAGWSDWRLA